MSPGHLYAAIYLMEEDTLQDGSITDEALETFRRRVGTKLRISNIFNELASADAIRKFADGIGDPNPLWRDEEYARSTRYGEMVAPPSWLASVFPTWVLQGLPGVHAFQTSTEWEFFLPVMLNDRITPESIFTGFKVINSDFAGRSILERQEARYFNQPGELVGSAKVAGLRAERPATRQKGKYSHIQLPHPWTERELEEIEAEVLGEEIRGGNTRYWEDVEVGDELPRIVRGPLGLSDIIAYCIGASPVQIKAHGLALREYRKHPPWAFRDESTFALEPIYGVHYNKAAAAAAGLPYPYDTAVQRHCWLMHLLTNWMGDDGWLKKSYARYRNFVYLSDVLWLGGKVARKYVDESGECCVDIRSTAINQRGEEVMPGISTVILPSREKGSGPVAQRVKGLPGIT
ncbi:MAG: MaoC family dehydratase N-terminal domain-containing protein [Dehalococcoidia bacterium]